MKKIVVIVLCVALIAPTAWAQLQGHFSIKISQFKGMVSDAIISDDPGASIESMNFDFVSSGGRTFLRSRYAFEVAESNVLPHTDINGLGVYRPTNSLEKFVVVADGDLYEDPTGVGAWTALRANICLNGTKDASFLTFKDTLLVMGDSAATYASGAMVDTSVIWGYRISELHQDRIYCAAGRYAQEEDGSRVVWFPEFDIAFDSVAVVLRRPGAGFVYVNRSDGDIIGAVKALGPYVMVYKTRGLFRMTISPTTNAPSQVIEVSRDVGVLNPAAVAVTDRGHYFVGLSGVYFTDGSSVRKISQGIDHYFRDSLTVTDPIVHFGATVLRDRLFITFPMGDTDADFRVLVYDIPGGYWFKWAMPARKNILKYTRTAINQASIMNHVPYEQECLLFTGYLDGWSLWRYPEVTAGFQDTVGGSASTRQFWYESNWFSAGDGTQRVQLNRVSIVSRKISGGANPSCTLFVFTDTDQSVPIDTVIFSPASTMTVTSKRLRPSVQGFLFKYRLDYTDNDGIEIHSVEFSGMIRGAVNATE